MIVAPVSNPIALELQRELSNTFNGGAFPSLDSPECGRTLLALAAAIEDEATVNALGVAAIALLAQRAQQSITAQRERAAQTNKATQ